MLKQPSQHGIWRQALIGLGLACFAGVPAAVSAPALLAPVYPGAVRDDAGTVMFPPDMGGAQGDAEDAHAVNGEQYEVYLSRDPWRKVRAFYDQHLGGPLLDFHKSYDNAFTIPCGERADICYGRVLMEQSSVAKILMSEGHSMVDAYDAGVMVEARTPPAEGQGQSDQAAAAIPTGTGGNPGADSQAAQQMARMDALEKQVIAAQKQMMAQVQAEGQASGIPDAVGMQRMSDLFEGLRNEVLANRHTEAELKRVYAQYKHLESAEFPSVRLPGGGAVPYDTWLLKKDKQAFEVQPTQAQMQARQQQAMQLEAAGKSDEAAQLMSGPDHWNDWLGFLKKLDAHAYRTRIVIYVDPESWKH